MSCTKDRTGPITQLTNPGKQKVLFNPLEIEECLGSYGWVPASSLDPLSFRNLKSAGPPEDQGNLEP